jgi:predicted transcriptional regulator
MNNLSNLIDCFCNSPQRLRILVVLDGRQMDVRDLMSALDCSRSAIQRNLTVLKKQDLVEETRSGYTTTTIGDFLRNEFARANETTAAIRRMTPFFEAVDAPPEIAIGKLTDALVTTPDPAQPNAPTQRLFSTFTGADRLYGFVPVVSGLIVEAFQGMTEDDTTSHEYVLSRASFDAIRTQCSNERTDVSETIFPERTEVSVYEGNIPYGLFVSGNRLALTAYTEVGRVQALVESTREEAIKWGERMYETYRDQSVEPQATDIPTTAHDAELVE